ncbi:MAG: 50S ribosomal protein L13 [Patescibacteria group bacterium]
MKTNMSPEHVIVTHRLDATGIPLGRLATKIADLLRGKTKPSFVHHLDQGDTVIVINAQALKLTGNKLDQKAYYHHTGYLGHLKTKTTKDLMQTNPGEVIERAVAGMLPKNRLRAVWLKRLTIHAHEEGANHGR